MSNTSSPSSFDLVTDDPFSSSSTSDSTVSPTSASLTGGSESERELEVEGEGEGEGESEKERSGEKGEDQSSSSEDEGGETGTREEVEEDDESHKHEPSETQRKEEENVSGASILGWHPAFQIYQPTQPQPQQQPQLQPPQPHSSQQPQLLQVPQLFQAPQIQVPQQPSPHGQQQPQETPKSAFPAFSGHMQSLAFGTVSLQEHQEVQLELQKANEQISHLKKRLSLDGRKSTIEKEKLERQQLEQKIANLQAQLEELNFQIYYGNSHKDKEIVALKHEIQTLRQELEISTPLVTAISPPLSSSTTTSASTTSTTTSTSTSTSTSTTSTLSVNTNAPSHAPSTPSPTPSTPSPTPPSPSPSPTPPSPTPPSPSSTSEAEKGHLSVQISKTKEKPRTKHRRTHHNTIKGVQEDKDKDKKPKKGRSRGKGRINYHKEKQREGEGSSEEEDEEENNENNSEPTSKSKKNLETLETKKLDERRKIREEVDGNIKKLHEENEKLKARLYELELAYFREKELRVSDHDNATRLLQEKDKELRKSQARERALAGMETYLDIRRLRSFAGMMFCCTDDELDL